MNILRLTESRYRGMMKSSGNVSVFAVTGIYIAVRILNGYEVAIKISYI